MKPCLTLLLLVLLTSASIAQEDAVLEALNKAKSKFDSDSTEFEDAAIKWFSSQKDRSRVKGDRDGLVSIETLEAEFSKTGKLPNTAPRSLRRKLESLNSRMESAYLLAIRDYTRAGNDRMAAETEKQLESFRKNLQQKPDRQLWTHGGGRFAMVGERVWEEKLSDGRIFRYKEIDRNEEYVELDAITGDTRNRVRLFDERSEVGVKPSLKFKKIADGKWTEE